MGQKVNPNMIRLGITRPWSSTWYANKKDFANFLQQEVVIRKMIKKTWFSAAISSISIERPAKNIKITVAAGRPGVIIGKKGDEVDMMRKRLSQLMSMPVHITIKEIKKVDLDAQIVAENVAAQLERRAMYRRVIKRSLQSGMKAGAKGIKICLSGRLGGAEIARTEWSREGRVPLHTFKAIVDYATARAATTYGIIGVKVWIYKGDKVRGQDQIDDNIKTNTKSK